MRKWTSLFLAVICLLAPTLALTSTRALAQDASRLSLLEIDLWPEYDRPTVLVIYRITLASDTTLPVNLTLKIPASAGAPFAVAARQLDGILVNIVYEQQSSGDWATIKFTATMPEIRVEYYDPGLVKQGEARHFAFSWPGGFQVDSLAVQVQQPVDSSNMRINPSLGNGSLGNEGLTYYSAQVGPLSTNQTFDLALDYQKTSDILTFNSIQVKPSQPLGPNTAGRKTLNIPTIILASLGVALIAGGAIWYFLSGRKDMRPSRRRFRSLQSESPEDAAGGVIYCHQCGNRASSGDSFCRVCGTRLRAE
jgi:hypothetical protein